MSADFVDSAIASDTAAAPGLEGGSPAETWSAIDHAVEELAALARTDVSPARFYRALLSGGAHALGATGGVVWHGDDTFHFRPIAQWDMAPRSLVGRSESWPQCFQAALKSDRTVIVPAANSPGEAPLLIGVVRTHEGGAVVVELALSPNLGMEGPQRSARLLDILLDVVADFDRQRELNLLRQTARDLRQFEQLVEQVHASLEPLATAYNIANEGRRWIDCDRLSVIQLRRGKPRVLAMSGIDHPKRDAAEVRALAKLGAVVAGQGDALAWQDGSSDELAPQVAAALNEYLDLALARRLLLLPMRGSGERESADDAPALCGVLVAEMFDERLPPEALRQRTETVGRHGGPALAAALAHHDIPLLPLQQKLGALLRFARRRRVALSLGAAAAALLALGLTVLPVDFSVEARGTLRPSEYRHLFAPEDGIVEKVLIRPGQSVAQGRPVVQLRDPALDLESSRTAGELQTAYARLAAIQARRATRRAADESRADERQWAAEEEQLKEHVRGLEEQQAMLSQQRASLQVTSPLDGVLLTWNADELLSDRPVKQGQLLLTVSDPSSPWILELKVADAQAGHILQAWGNGRQTPAVTFLLATDPAVTHRGRLTKVASRAEVGDDAGLSILATARLEGPPPTEARAGAGVIARIHCGRRAAGYVWLHEFIDAARRYWF